MSVFIYLVGGRTHARACVCDFIEVILCVSYIIMCPRDSVNLYVYTKQ